MHAAYVDEADVYSGPGAVPADTFKFSVSCRYVPNTAFILGLPTFMRYTGYVIWNGSATSASAQSIVPPDVTFDTSKADIWHFGFDPSASFMVLWAETVSPPHGTPYRRAYLLLL